MPTHSDVPTYMNKRLGKGFIKIPHVLILGAGASRATFPKGDLHGLKLPLMNDLVEVIGLNDLLRLAKIKYANGDNFEAVFSNIADDASKQDLQKKIENMIFAYFSKMKIQDELTIYDKLILTLREKDIIATFNWDPLLLYAYRRCGHFLEPFKIKMPELVFLHGNAALGICYEDKVLGPMDSACSKCRNRFKQVPLIYPILTKDYSSDLVIKEQWDKLRDYIGKAYFITIFGYSAPYADVEAIKLMQDAAKKNPRKNLYEIEMIDIKDGEILAESWKDFIVRGHYRTCKVANRSYLFQHPRRSIEAFFDCFLQNSPWPDNPMPDCVTFNELSNWIMPLLEEEVIVND